MPKYYGESEFPEKCNVWQDLSYGATEVYAELKPGSLVGVLAPKSVLAEYEARDPKTSLPGFSHKISRFTAKQQWELLRGEISAPSPYDPLQLLIDPETQI